MTATALPAPSPEARFPEPARYPKTQMLQLEPSEFGKPLPHGFTWWFGLLVWGFSKPRGDDEIAHAKWKWNAYSEAERKELQTAADRQLDSLRSSTADIIGRLAVLAVLAGFNVGVVVDLVKNHSIWTSVFAWLTLALIAGSVVCLVLIVSPKAKVWLEQKFSTTPVILAFMENMDNKGWPLYLKTANKIEHRKQLIRLERRLQSLAGIFTIASLVTLGVAVGLG